MSVQFSAGVVDFEIINVHIEQSGMVSNVLLFDVPCEYRRKSLLAIDCLKMRSFSFI